MDFLKIDEDFTNLDDWTDQAGAATVSATEYISSPTSARIDNVDQMYIELEADFGFSFPVDSWAYEFNFFIDTGTATAATNFFVQYFPSSVRISQIQFEFDNNDLWYKDGGGTSQLLLADLTREQWYKVRVEGTDVSETPTAPSQTITIDDGTPVTGLAIRYYGAGVLHRISINMNGTSGPYVYVDDVKVYTDVGTISGVIKDAGVAAEYNVQAYLRSTGVSQGSTTSEADGTYVLETTETGEHFVIAQGATDDDRLIKDRITPV